MKKETLFRASALCPAVLCLSLFAACSSDSGNPSASTDEEISSSSGVDVSSSSIVISQSSSSEGCMNDCVPEVLSSSSESYSPSSSSIAISQSSSSEGCMNDCALEVLSSSSEQLSSSSFSLPVEPCEDDENGKCLYVASYKTNFELYPGSGDVLLELDACDEMPKIGTFSGGKLTYTLPASVSAGCFVAGTDAFEGANIQPSTLQIAPTEGFRLHTYETLYYGAEETSDGTKRWNVLPVYFSEAATISGNYQETDDGYTDTHTFSIEAVAGWNWIVVSYLETNQGNYEIRFSSDQSQLPSNMRWEIMVTNE